MVKRHEFNTDMFTKLLAWESERKQNGHVAVGVDHVTHSLTSQYLGSWMVTTAKGFL